MRKIKISKILGVGLSLALLFSLLGAVTPASAGTLSISDEKLVTDLKGRVDNIIGPASVDIIDLAVNGSTMYAATGIPGATAVSETANVTFKSTNGGATWASLYTTTDYPKTRAVRLVAVASDDPNVLVIVTNEPEVYFSTNGGTKWSDMNVPTTGTKPVVSIRDIDISAGDTRYVAIGGQTTGGVAELWTMEMAMAQSWQPNYSYAGAMVNQTDIMAVKFSPNAFTDETITAISANGTLAMVFQVFRFTENSESWNKSIAREGMLEWPTGGISLGSVTTALGTADIALMPTYLATDQGERVAFAAFTGTGGGGAVTRLIDKSKANLDDWSDEDVAGIGSLALNADGSQLLAGAYRDNLAYTWANPVSGSTPNAERTNSLKPPSGEDKTLVAWSGDTSVAATSGDESAFSVSTDDGYAWNDISMIDTTITGIADVAISADGKKFYITTWDGGVDTSVWLNETSWKRVLSKQDNASATTAQFLVRLAPADAAVVYISSKTTKEMWVSKNSGTSTWKNVPAYKLSSSGIEDFVVVDADTVYAVDSSGCSKTTNAGAGWGDAKGLDGLTAKNITLAPNGDVLVGGTSYIAFSKDSGATFEKSLSSPKSGTCFIVPDKDYATNSTVYVGVGDAVYRGKAQKATQTWSARGPTVTSGQTVTGMGRVEGVIYVVTSSSSAAAIHRALNLTPTVDSSDLALWSNLTKSYALNASPQSLRISSGPKLWAIDTAGVLLASMTDPIATVGPTLSAPADAVKVLVNPDTGKAFNVVFTWKRYSSDKITKMQLQVATESAFTGVIYDQVFSGIDSDSIAKIVGPTGPSTTSTITETITESQVIPAHLSPVTSWNGTGWVTTNQTIPAQTITTSYPVTRTVTVSQVAEFSPGSTYYWRVRVAQDGPLYSPWSKAQSFAVEAIVEPFDITSPIAGSYDVPVNPLLTWTPYAGAIGYELMVAEDPTFAIIDFSYNVAQNLYKVEDTLKNSTTYYWRVRGVTGEAKLVGTKMVVPAGPWITGIFTTAAVPAEPTPPVVITQPSAPEVKIVEVPVTTQAPISAPLLWAIVVIGAVLVIALITLIVRTRRVA